MSTQFYNEMAQLVIDLLDEFGVNVLVTRTDMDTAVVSVFTIRAIFVDPISFRIRPVELGAIDRRLVCNNKQMIIDTDRISANGGTWILTRVDAIQPADLVLGYKAEMRVG